MPDKRRGSRWGEALLRMRARDLRTPWLGNGPVATPSLPRRLPRCLASVRIRTAPTWVLRVRFWLQSNCLPRRRFPSIGIAKENHDEVPEIIARLVLVSAGVTHG